MVGSLLLGLFDDAGALQHVGSTKISQDCPTSDGSKR
jgi:hypothetical protein